MTLEEILSSLLGSGGQQAPQIATPVGDHAGTVQQRLGGMPQQQQAMPQQAPQGQPMPQSAPQPAPVANGGGLGGILQNIIAPQSAQKNKTVSWLTSQGLDQGTATVLASNKSALQSYILQRSQGNKPIEIAGKLVDPKTYQVLADFSTPGNRQTATIDGKLIDTNTGQVIGDYGSGGTQTMTPEEVTAAGLTPGVYQKDKEGKISAVGSVRDQDAGFKNEMELRKEYDLLPEVKDYKVVRSNYERIRQGTQLGTGAGDAAIVFGYMKMLDPTSVVREGEQASARNAAGVPEGLRGMYNNLIGGGQLSGEARQQILGAAEKVYGESSANIEDVNKRYGGYAGAWKLDPSRIVSPAEQYSPLAPPQGQNGGNLPLPPQQSAPPPQMPQAPAAPAQNGVVDWKDYFGKKGR